MAISTTIEYPQLLEIDTDEDVRVLRFTSNGEHLVSGSQKGVGMWGAKDGKQVAAMPVREGVNCVAASRDRRWVAGGTSEGRILVWDATTYELASEIESGPILDIDFSPDSPRLVSVDDFHTDTAAIWDISTCQRVSTLRHTGLWNEESVFAAKYSPQGDRIATATNEAVRVWDSKTGGFKDIDVKVRATGLLWSENHLLVQTDTGTIKQIDAATGLIVFEWPVPCADSYLCIALPQHGKFIACSAEKTISFWDTVAHTQFMPIHHTHKTYSIACSSDGRLLAFAVEGKFIVKDLSSVIFPLILDPEFDIDSTVLNAWKRSQLEDAEAMLSEAIPRSKNRNHVLASRALVRARLGHWGDALVDAEKSIDIQRSLVGYIAKCVALVGTGEKHMGFWMCDIACLHFPSAHVSLLLLIKVVVLFMAGEHLDAMSCMEDLVADAWVDPALYVVQAYMHLLLGNKLMESANYERAIQSFQEARIKLRDRTRHPPLIISLISGWKFDDIAITIQQRLCEALLAVGRTKEACESMLRMLDDINVTEAIKTWVSDFKYRCRIKLEDLGDRAVNTKQYDEAIAQYTAALSLNLTVPQDLLVKRSNAWVGKGALEDALNDTKDWVGLMLKSGSWKDALTATAGFTLERFTVYRAVCEHLEMTGRIIDAVACFHRISREPAQAHEIGREQANWTCDFKIRYRNKLESLGDSASIAKQYDEAISQYTATLLLDPDEPQDLLVKRSRAYAEMGQWEDALNDANEAIKSDPSSPSGHERKYAALDGIGHYDEAIDAFKTMLSKMSGSSDPEIRERFRRYEQTRKAIRTSIKEAIRHSPLVLINTLSGRMCNKTEQAAAFESTPAFTRLIMSMTTHIDHALIKRVVGEFYHYATLSHTWEGNEPLYKNIIKIVVYDLGPFPTHEKLRMFCKIVRDEGFNWAWSDTCCIDKGDHFVLQEALVSMFRWYEESAMTIIFLCDVDRLAGPGALTMSIWNMRGWTLQEYHASKVVRIYTKDWTPYLGLTIYNHKDSPEITSEMEQATGISAETLMALRPGLNDIRQKLRLASTRQTTRVEDAAYSLLGIFSMTLPVTYGEKDKALGRFLSQLLTSSGDTSILAWTGRSGSFNSCLPTNIAVFSQPLTSHIPPAIADGEMGTIAAGLFASSLGHDLVARLYDEVDKLPTPSFAAQRMKLPCIAFKIRTLSPFQNGSEFIFRLQAGVLDTVEIKTKQNLSRLDSLYLVHPWIDFLLDRHAARNIVETAPDEDETSEVDECSSSDSFQDCSSTSHADHVDTPPPPSPSAPLSMDAQTRAYQFLARLQQPFGALLLAPTRKNAPEYRRIVTENLITVQVGKITAATLNELIQGARVLDVL